MCCISYSYSASTVAECIDGDIRRMEDPEGLIEICVRNTWARLCADYLEQSEATVACRQLGFSAESRPYIVLLQKKMSCIKIIVLMQMPPLCHLE